MINIVIIQYNGEEFIERLMKSVMSQSVKPDRVIVVDNGKTDCRAVYEGYNANLTYIKNPVNRGFPAAVNQGIIEADEGMIILLNNDVYLDNDFIKNAAADIHQGDAEFFAPLVMRYDSDIIDSAGDNYGNYIMPVKRLSGMKADSAYKKEYVEGFSMSACYFNREHFLKAGMLDESFFLYFEDADFSLRAAAEGYRIMYSPDAKAWHYVSAGTKIETGSEYSALKVYYESRNRMLLIRRHYKGGLKHLVRLIMTMKKTALFHLLKTGYYTEYLNGTIKGITCRKV